MEDEMILTVNSSPRRQPWTTVLSLSRRTVPFLPGSPNLFIYLHTNPPGFWHTVTPLWTLITLVPVCLQALTASPSCSPDATSLISLALHSPGRIFTPAVRSSHMFSRDREVPPSLCSPHRLYGTWNLYLLVCLPSGLPGCCLHFTLRVCVRVCVKRWFKTSSIGDYCNGMDLSHFAANIPAVSCQSCWFVSCTLQQSQSWVKTIRDFDFCKINKLKKEDELSKCLLCKHYVKPGQLCSVQAACRTEQTVPGQCCVLVLCCWIGSSTFLVVTHEMSSGTPGACHSSQHCWLSFQATILERCKEPLSLHNDSINHHNSKSDE